jgi:hypothetical protein
VSDIEANSEDAAFKTPLRIRRNNQRWRKAHKAEFSKYAADYAQRHTNRRMWSVAKQRAKRRGIEFSIDPEDIVIPSKCPVFGFDLVCGVGKSNRPGGNRNSPSLDRIDQSRGYIKGNIRVISHLANTMKLNATADELVAFATWAIKEYANA